MCMCTDQLVDGEALEEMANGDLNASLKEMGVEKLGLRLKLDTEFDTWSRAVWRFK